MDRHDQKCYGQSPGADPTGPQRGSRRTLRGGNWCRIALTCRSAFRSSQAPDFHSPFAGLRVCLVGVESGK
jgi:formylglycine-generating enzyme required for sulfatase activity